MKSRVIITGASGFIGKSLVRYLSKHQISFYSLSMRSFSKNDIENLEKVFRTYKPDFVIHLAALVHKRNDSKIKSIKDVFEVNTFYPHLLSKVSSKYQVKKFIYISSIGVHGDHQISKVSLNENSPIKPSNIYSLSKYNAERLVISNLIETSTNFSIIRPSIVFGENAPGSFKTIKKIISLGLPLPLKSLVCTRNILHVNDLSELIYKCIYSDSSDNQIFVASGHSEFSILQIFRLVSKTYGYKLRSFYLPKLFLRILVEIVFQRSLYLKLSNNLLIDSSKARKLLKWKTII
ncbi:NAD-dependent epimerase/dehydratase family protein [Prochlorococcus marinus]|uniref:NAD-dependent epimerase/dehydratase family protein n=1 Tax=Prochlorococcus marinus TaxID=1219 RepID=UPI0039AFA940